VAVVVGLVVVAVVIPAVAGPLFKLKAVLREQGSENE
jgi:hypothetical protein